MNMNVNMNIHMNIYGSDNDIQTTHPTAKEEVELHILLQNQFLTLPATSTLNSSLT